MIIGFTSQKGGVGKSTLAVHALGWAIREGISACLIDTDPQASSSDWISDWNSGNSKAEAHLITDPKQIGQAVNESNRKHKLVFIDSRGSLDTGSKSVMLMADRICVPCRPSRLDFAAAVETLKLALKASDQRKTKAELSLVPTMVDRRRRMTYTIMDDLEQLGIPVMPSISDRASFVNAAEDGNFVWDQGDSVATADIEILMQELTKQ